MGSTLAFIGVVALLGALCIVPGFVVLMSARLTSIERVVYAPFISILLISFVTITASRMNLALDPVMVVALTLLCGVLVLFVLRGIERFLQAALPHLLEKPYPARGFIHRVFISPYYEQQAPRRFSVPEFQREIILLIWSLAVGIMAFIWVYLIPVGDLSHFALDVDNVTHLNVLRRFIDTEIYSPWMILAYYGSDASIMPFESGGGFYPVFWHTIGALGALFVHAGPAYGVHVANAVFCALLYPLSLFALARVVVPRNTIARVLFPMVGVLFGSFPWRMLTFGPLYPNVAGFCLVFLALSLVIQVISKWTERGFVLVGSCLWYVMLALGALVFVHPNAVFTTGVFSISFILVSVYRHRWHLKNFDEPSASVIMTIFAACAIAFIWLAVFHLPAFQGVVMYNWEAMMSRGDALVSFLTMSFTTGAPQIMLAIFVMVGVVYAFLLPQWRPWVLTYGFTVVMFAFASASEGFWKHLLTGFWYTDPWRISSMCALAAMPLATLGMYEIVVGITRVLLTRVSFVRMHYRAFLGGFRRKGLFAACVSVAIAFICTMPFVDEPYYQPLTLHEGNIESANSGFEVQRVLISEKFEHDYFTMFSEDKQDFVSDVRDYVAPGEYVLNFPDDGSVFGYSIEHAPLYYRYLSGIDDIDERVESRMLREHIQDVSRNKLVQAIVKNQHISYVMLLENPRKIAYNEHAWTYEYNARAFMGPRSITAATPGFEPVLQRGDMRLYKIVLPDTGV